MNWWPGPGWGPWDTLTDAGYIVTDDPRNLHPPCVWFQIDAAEVVGVCKVQFEVVAHVVAPGPDHADAHKWMWTGPVPLLLPAATEPAQAADLDGYPTVQIRLQHVVGSQP